MFNAITLRAYKKLNLKSLDEFISLQFSNKDSSSIVSIDSIIIDSSSKNSRLVYFKIEKTSYIGKSYFILFEEFGYVINYIALPYSFKRDIAKFENFYKTLRLL